MTVASRRGEYRANPLADDRVFARLHHPDADDQLLPRARTDLDARLALAQLS